MDIFSHGLWAGAAAKGINLRKETLRSSRGKPLNVWLTAFWGVFPDLFAFTIPFVWLFFNLVSGNSQLSDIHRPTGAEPDDKLLFGNGNSGQAQSSIAYLTSVLYNISHSLVIFLLVFGLVIIARKIVKKENAVPWEMCGWLLHILFDIPTHSYEFYPTPVFWPIGGWKFQGYPWAHPLFIAVDYSAIVITYLALRYFGKNISKRNIS